jgi:murein DD-endopeptidase MepM/ murein hydrolase activator NlpD
VVTSVKNLVDGITGAVLSERRILAQSTTLARHLMASRAVAIMVLAGAGIVAAFAFAPDSMSPGEPSLRIVRELSVPVLAPVAQGVGYWREERVQRGDTLGSVLARLGINDAPAQNFLRTDAGARPLYQLRPGKAVRVQADDDGRLIALSYLAQGGDLLTVKRTADGFSADSAPPGSTVRLELRAGEIRSSLFAASDAVGLPDAITMQLAEVFSGDIDFHHDLRRGDWFAVVYEMRDIDGQPAGAGRIVAAEFVNKGNAYRAFSWQGSDGAPGYYAEDGKNLRKAFMRSPVSFTRITSGFSMARFHPFLQTWRAHKGVDFAAPTGTPVHAAGDGTVASAGRENGYGNAVVLKHGAAYSTVYAHLSRFASGIKPGMRVAQGDVIGYVGQTGWATGPHLHYEFRVNNEQRNPMTIALPAAQPLPAAERAAYLERVELLSAQLALGHGVTIAGAQ